MVSRLRSRLGPLWPYAVLTGIPAAVFVLPDLFGGHLLMTGDNVQQNYPLHVLVGSMVRHGQLPFWNPYLFSGTPLLAGFNAGAFYPLAGLFVILPDRAAWIATEVILFSLIGVGMYMFLRALALSTAACVLAAVTFVGSGVVLGQANHVDMTEGFASIPFMLLAVLYIVRDGRWRWSVLLGLGGALVIFGGAPEAMLDEALLILAYAAMSAGLDRARWWRVLTRGGAGAALALALAAVQWLPGITAIANSQRSGLGSTFASSGSFPPTYGLLSLVPYLYGGFGHLGEAMFFSTYNLPEVEIYMGILPVIAVLSLWRRRWPSRLAARERITWYVVGLIGILLALGPHTPLEHLFDSIPLYGQQRLQSRNMIDVAVATCVLFAGWIDRSEDARDKSVGFDRRLALVPFTVVLALAGWALIDPASLVTTLSSGVGSAAEAHTVREATLVALGFCLAAALLVWFRPVLPPRRWLFLVAALTVLDLGLSAGTSELVTVPSNAVIAGSTAIEKQVAAHLSPGGRFVVYDPQAYRNGSSDLETGLPDDNILAGLPSVGGYASIVSGNYDAQTSTHTTGQLDVGLFGAGDPDGLDLQEVVTAPEYFLLPLRGSPATLPAVRQVSEAPGTDPVLPMGIDADVAEGTYPTYPAPRPAVVAGKLSMWLFGESLRVARARVLLASPAAGAQIRFGQVRAGGAVRWGTPVTVAAGARSAAGPLPPGQSVGLAVQVLNGRLPPQQATIAVGPRVYEIDGPLSDVVRPGLWRPQGSVDNYSLFGRTTPPRPVYVVSPAGRPPPQVGVVSDSASAETVRVRTASPAVLVRDVAWDDGWHASVTVDRGRTTTLRIAPRGLVEQVRLPAGADLVTFTYQPPHWLVATVLSVGATLFLFVLAVVMVFRRSRLGRRRRSRSRSSLGRRSRSRRSRSRRGEDRGPPPARPAPPALEPARDPYVVSSRGGPA
jgi:hypothetical protein